MGAAVVQEVQQLSASWKVGDLICGLLCVYIELSLNKILIDALLSVCILWRKDIFDGTESI